MRKRSSVHRRGRRGRLAALLGGLGAALLAGAALGQEAAEQATPAASETPPSATTNGTPGASPTGDTGPLARLPIVRRRLDNGLRVVLSPERTVPTVAVAVYYDVGSRNEQPGRSGFAHLFEHMMFQGSANVGKGEHFKLINERGGRANGTTSTDRTNYFETLPSNELELALWLEADRMRSLAVTAENFENQRETVKEERRQRIDNQPYARSFIRINELAYGDYWPYAHPTIGSMQDLDNAPLQDVQRFFETYYAPNNAVLVIAGDFEVEEAMALVRKHFGDLEPAEVPPFEPPPLRPQTAERKEVMLDPLAALPAFHVAWHIPPRRHPDHYALEIVAAALGDGRSSRLYQRLVKREEQLREIYVGTDDRRGPDLFSVWAIVAEGGSGEKARQAIDEEIARIGREGLDERTLQKAKHRIAASLLFGLQSNQQRALRLGEYELYWGDATLLREELSRYRAVTDEDVRRVVREYLVTANRTVLDVLPPRAASSNAEGSR